MTSKLQIQTSLKNGKTILVNSFFTPPLKLADVTEEKSAHALRLMIMNSSPGILDNDAYEIQIKLEDDCHLELETQSYQRIFQMKAGARQEMTVRMGVHSSFIFLPHPSVPHENSVFRATNKFYLQDNCNLIWGEILTCGRKLYGEVFRFSEYHTITEIYLSGKLIAKENLLVAPLEIDVQAIGQLEGYSHQASMICIVSTGDDQALFEEVHLFLLSQNDVSFGISALAMRGFVVRILGYNAEQLHFILKQIAQLALKHQTTVKTLKTPVYAE